MPKKKKGKNRRQGKVRSNPKGDKMGKQVQEKKDTQYEDILQKIEKIGDPYDSMNMKTKKTHALAHFYEHLKVQKCKIDYVCLNYIFL